MTRADLQVLLREPVVRWVLTGLVGLLLGGAVAWGTIVANQTRMQRALDEWQHRAPAPADTTRQALQFLDREIRDVKADLRELRRELGKPR